MHFIKKKQTASKTLFAENLIGLIYLKSFSIYFFWVREKYSIESYGMKIYKILIHLFEPNLLEMLEKVSVFRFSVDGKIVTMKVSINDFF